MNEQILKLPNYYANWLRQSPVFFFTSYFCLVRTMFRGEKIANFLSYI